MKIYDNGIVRDATPEEIAVWKAACQPTPEPSPQEQAMMLARTLASSVTTLSDTTALAIPDLLPRWDELLAAGQPIQPGVCLVHNGQTYRQVQSVPVTPQVHQPPGGEGMLAVYRPIVREHAGTVSDPIPWVRGMDCELNKYYVRNGVIYRAKQNMTPCVWEPGSDGSDTVWDEVS
ncbi:Uncharacterised protein [uncultured Flavonifractor sp.]|nr:Uncharacterised protein [uncultured Flavonifractor sp.]